MTSVNRGMAARNHKISIPLSSATVGLAPAAQPENGDPQPLLFPSKRQVLAAPWPGPLSYLIPPL